MSGRSVGRVWILATLLLVLPSLAARCKGPGNIIDVRSLGAACDGRTDDAPVLQAALSAVENGGTVLIPCMLGIGEAGVLLADRSGVTVRGTGRRAGIRSLAVTTQRADRFGPVLFLLRRCEGCVVERLSFEGAGLDVAPLGLDTCSRTTIRRNRITNVGSVGGGALVGTGGIENRYLDNEISDTAGAPPGKPYGHGATRGIWLGNVFPGSEERHSVIEGNRFSSLGHTGIATHMVGGVIRGNVVEKAGGAGLKLMPPPGIVEGRTLVEGNTFRENVFCGVQLQDAHHITLRNNRMESNDHPGIYISGEFSDSLIEDNLILDNDRADDGRRDGGIIVHRATNVVIRNNEIRDTRRGDARTQNFGIRLLSRNGPLTGLEVSGNRCDNHLFDGILIEIEDEIDDVEVFANRCGHNSGYGLAVTSDRSGDTPGLRVCGNDFAGNRRGELNDTGMPEVRNPSCR
jgi:parallel beta-helix repeat protein